MVSVIYSRSNDGLPAVRCPSFKMYEPVVPVLSGLMDKSGINTIIDLASGGGGPWPALAPELKKSHPGLKVILTDAYPNAKALKQVKERAEDSIEIMTQSVDALNVPDSLKGIRTQFLSLHHFRPEQARALFENAVKAQQSIAVFEFQKRSIAQIIQFALSPIFVLLLTFTIRPVSITRLLFTYIIPVVPLFVMWDGVVSVLMTYTVNEIKQMIDSIPQMDTYFWDICSTTGRGVTVFRAVGTPKIK